MSEPPVPVSQPLSRRPRPLEGKGTAGPRTWLCRVALAGSLYLVLLGVGVLAVPPSLPRFEPAPMVAGFLPLQDAVARTRWRGHLPGGAAHRPPAHVQGVSAPTSSSVPLAVSGCEAAPVPMVAAFYVPGQAGAATAAERHLGSLTHLIADWLVLDPDGEAVRILPDDCRDRLTRFCRARGTRILAMLTNHDRCWDGVRLRHLLRHRASHLTFARNLLGRLQELRVDGVNLDFEGDESADHDDLVHLVAALRSVLGPAGLLVTQDVGASANLTGLAALDDYVILMAYDEHDENGGAGPIASQAWVRDCWAAARASVGADRLVLAVGNYAYDWSSDGGRDMTWADAMATAASMHPCQASARVVAFDAASLESTFEYSDGVAHTVWMLDAVTAFNAWCAVASDRPAGLALWSLGGEDPTIWSFLDRKRLARVTGATETSAVLRAMSCVPLTDRIDGVGRGEVFQVDSCPQAGVRSLHWDEERAVVDDVVWRVWSAASTVRHVGRPQPGSVALTFDDGPDVTTTPRILDLLHSYDVPATFFVLGENAARHPDLVRRIWAEGHELGNHAFTHPDLAAVSLCRATLELDATWRLLEFETGHAALAVRAPSAADPNPADESALEPARQIARVDDACCTVGASIDPRDWEVGATKEAAESPVVSRDLGDGSDADHRERASARSLQVTGGGGVESAATLAQSVLDSTGPGGGVVLLHDGGGDRSATIGALPLIMDGLRARGFRFVTVAERVGLPRRALNPAVEGTERVWAWLEGSAIEVAFAVPAILRALLEVSLLLSLARTLLVFGLVVVARMREMRRSSAPVVFPARSGVGAFAEVLFPPGALNGQPHPGAVSRLAAEGRSGSRCVSVLIAARNEAAVIGACLAAVRATAGVEVEVIVVDDGSTDDTSERVRRATEDFPSAGLCLIRQSARGKAEALNLGLGYASGDIVVTLDADTVCCPDTVAALCGPFEDPRVGAVAGNVRVGNRGNAVTRFQNIEYVLGQQMERRAAALLDAVQVVPGAVGAWRRGALVAAGGWSAETLAEDTDLTWTLHRRGWRVASETRAVAFTEAPDSLRALLRQRLRWTLGTLQCLWKHRAGLGRRSPLGLYCMPTVWVWHVGFPLLAPLVALQGGWVLLGGAEGTVALLLMALLFVVIDVVRVAFAFRLEGERRPSLCEIVAAHVCGHVLGVVVVWRAVWTVLTEERRGWGVIPRKSSVVPARRAA